MPRSSSRTAPVARPLPRVASILALVATVALVAGCGNTTESIPPTATAPATQAPSAVPATIEPAPTPTPTPEPTPAETVAGVPPCVPADLRADSGAWNAGAGSRFADVSVVNQGGAACTLPIQPSVAITDPGGAVLLATDPVREAPGPTLAAGAGMSFMIQFTNWCDPSIALPARTLLVIGSGGVEIADLGLATVDDLPPCNGPDLPATLTATEWTPG